MNKRTHIHMPTNPLDKATDALTWFFGSWLFTIVSVIWFVLWFVLRVELFPFGLLTLIVSLLAIFMANFILMSGNRQSKKDRLRDNLEANEVSEILNNHQELLQINRTQLTILNQQSEILTLLHGGKHV